MSPKVILWSMMLLYSLKFSFSNFGPLNEYTDGNYLFFSIPPDKYSDNFVIIAGLITSFYFIAKSSFINPYPANVENMVSS
jgi:hypothetical protein